MTSTEALARNTNHRSDSGRGLGDAPASRGCTARASSDDLAAGGVEAIGLMLSGCSLTVQQNSLRLLRAILSVRQRGSLRGSFCLAGVTGPASSRHRR